MRFKLFLLLAMAVFAACAPVEKNDTKNENIIGQELQTVSPLRTSDGSRAQDVTLFDPVIKRLHQFNLVAMTFIRTVSVLNPNEKHYVLDSGDSKYIVDLSLKHISIFDRNSAANHNPIRFQGSPRSSAFRPDLGWLVVYDDLQSVGVLQLDTDGRVLRSHVFGAVVANGKSIVSGDLLSTGELILALSDNSLAIVDLEASLNAQPRRWVATVFATNLAKVNWIAPLHNRADRLLIKTADEIVLYDLTNRLGIQARTIESDDIYKLSKSYDPHVLLRTGERSMQLIYSDGNQLLTRSFELLDLAAPVLRSDLDLQRDYWTYVYSSVQPRITLFNDINQEEAGRQLVRYRVSDQLALQKKTIDDRTQVHLGPDFMFALYPSVLGFAKRISIEDSSEIKVEKFNLKKYAP